MIYTELTRKAINIAYKAHEGQLDRSGIPYIFHPYHVAEQMKDELTCCAALLHDVIEDTDLTANDLRESGIPDSVIEIVLLLTHEDDTDYFDYVRKLAPNPYARAVKLADLAHNGDLSRISGTYESPEKTSERMKKYAAAKQILSEYGS